jgi:hypothetical protein
LHAATRMARRAFAPWERSLTEGMHAMTLSLACSLTDVSHGLFGFGL